MKTVVKSIPLFMVLAELNSPSDFDLMFEAYGRVTGPYYGLCNPKVVNMEFSSQYLSFL